MHIVLVGLNHRTAPVGLRERVAFGPEQQEPGLVRLRRELGLPEALILSTCNRVEIYAGVPELDGTLDRLAAFLGSHGRLGAEELHARLYRYSEPRSIEHLFSVVSGLDSMVIGETEILQQVKQAYETARRHGATGKSLNVLFQKALNAGKAVHERTRLGQGCLSVGTVAIELAQKIFGSLADRTVVLAGAGKVGELVIQRLAERGAGRQPVILNRSAERAQELAARYGGQAFGLDALPARLVEADVLITSISSSQPLVTGQQMAAVMVERRQRPLCLVDLGVPRNIDPAAGQLDNVYLFDIDDLEGLVNHHAVQRQDAIRESELIVRQKVGHFLSWWLREHGPCPVPLSSASAAVP